jgi:hypothetical protein
MGVFAALLVHVFLGQQRAGRHEGQTEDGQGKTLHGCSPELG